MPVCDSSQAEIPLIALSKIVEPALCCGTFGSVNHPIKGLLMARTPALSNGPVEFTDVGGNQVSLPLSSIFFDGKTIHAEGSIYNSHKAAADDWLTYLAKIGEIVPDADPPSKTAMVITAKHAGSTGNFIQIQFSNPDNSDSTNVKFDATVTETDTYPGLTPAT